MAKQIPSERRPLKGAPITLRIKAAVIEAFVAGQSPTQASLAAEAGTGSWKAVAQRLYKWTAAGICQVQRARTGVGMSPYTFNFTGMPIEEQSLRTGLEAYLLAPEAQIPAWRKRAVRTAIRHTLSLGTRCSDAVLLAAAGKVPVSRLHGFAQRVYEATADDPAIRDAKHQAETRRADVRHLIRWCAEQDRIPMVFPCLREADAWESMMDTYLPTKRQVEAGGGEHPLTESERSVGRAYWSDLKEAVRVIQGPDYPAAQDPAHLTLEDVERVRVHFTQRGEDARWRGIDRLLSLLARRMHYGPYLQRPDRSTCYLQAPPGMRATDYEGFLAAFDAAGFPPEMREFFEWYRAYSTGKRRELDAGGFPPRRPIHKLKDRSLIRRATNVRMFAGVAIHRLGLDPATLTPQALFGRHAKDIAHALEDYWAERAKEGALNHELSAGLWQCLVSVAQVSQVLYRKMRFEAGQPVFTEEEGTRGGKEWRRSLVGEEAAAKTLEEQEVWDAYAALNQMGSAIEGEIKEDNVGNTANTERHIKEIWRQTPATWYLALLESCLAELQKLHHAGKRNSARYHSLVWSTYVLAWQISTGMRRCELSNVRLDIQYNDHYRKRRIVVLRAVPAWICRGIGG